MGRKLVAIGLFLLIVPFVVMVGEIIIAELSGAVGDHRSYAGIWGAIILYFTFIPGLIMFVVGLILSLVNL